MTDSATLAHGQQAHAVRLEWGPTGAAAVAAEADIAVVVDLLSFTTTLCVALERGITVYPYPWRDAGAGEYAAARSAALAVGRLEAGGAPTGQARVSLSPAQVAAVSGVERLVLPSPNGSSICFDLAATGVEVLGACLRNRSAVARWLAPRVASGTRVAVVAAGERWPDGSLRPGVEDLWGAGGVIAGLLELGATGLSPEALMAAAAYDAVKDRLGDGLLGCASGQELASAGFADDVAVAAEHDVSDVVPLLQGDAFGLG